MHSVHQRLTIFETKEMTTRDCDQCYSGEVGSDSNVQLVVVGDKVHHDFASDYWHARIGRQGGHLTMSATIPLRARLCAQTLWQDDRVARRIGVHPFVPPSVQRQDEEPFRR